MIEKYNFHWKENFFYNFLKKRKLFTDLLKEIGAKQIIALMGMRRTGKTTILKIIAGKVTSDDGKILFNDGSGLKKWDSFRSSNYVWVPQRLGDIITEYVKIHELKKAFN